MRQFVLEVQKNKQLRMEQLDSSLRSISISPHPSQKQRGSEEELENSTFTQSPRTIISDVDFDFSEVSQLQENCQNTCSKFVSEYRNRLLPVYDANEVELVNGETQLDLYRTFLKSGCLIIKNVYGEDVMKKYNKWAEVVHETVKVNKSRFLNF